MADTIKKAEYCYATVDDKAGEGARVLDALRQAGLSLLAFHAFPVGGGKSQLDFVAADPARLDDPARKAGVTLSAKKTVFLIDGQDRAGALAEVLGKLASARINVTAVDAVCSGGGRFGALLWVKPGDVEKAAQALGAR
ncbi:MAG: ACT domain-containing protein [Gemmatimonadales bacterium]